MFYAKEQRYLSYEKFPFYTNTHLSVPTTYDYSHDLLYKAHEKKVILTAPIPNETKFTINLMINKKIIKSKTLDELFSLLEIYLRSFNEVNMVTMIHRIAIQCKDSITRNKIKQDERFKLLLELIVYRCNFPHRFSPKELANIVWSLVKIGINNHILFDIISHESILQLEKFVSINLSIILWSFAKAGKFYKNLFVFAIPKILSEIENLDPQQLANITWSYSKVGLISPHLFENLSKRSINTLDNFLPINISMLCYAFALADIVPKNLFELVSNLDIEKFTPKAVVHILWSFSVTEFTLPLSWLNWICNIEKILTLSLHELNLLTISLSLNYLEGLVQLKVNNPDDYININNYNKYKINICKALAIRDRDPENALIEWHESIENQNMIKIKNNKDSSSKLNHDLIWSTIDILIPQIVEKFRFYKEVFDTVWILSLIGKNISIFIEKLEKLSFEYEFLKNKNYFNLSIDLIQNTLTTTTSPHSSCCNYDSFQDTENSSNNEINDDLEVQFSIKKFNQKPIIEESVLNYNDENTELKNQLKKAENTNKKSDIKIESNILILSIFLYNLVLITLVIFK